MNDNNAMEAENALDNLDENKIVKNDMVNKRIDFDTKTFRRLETMMPIYTQGEKGTNSEQYSLVIRKAVNALFDGDFKEKLEEL